MPQRSNVPVRKFSMTTSDLATNFFKISFPFSVRKSNVNDFLFLASAGQRNGSSPLNGPICLKLSPVLGISILITSAPDRKSTRLNSSHVKTSYAVFCLKKKKETRYKSFLKLKN